MSSARSLGRVIVAAMLIGAAWLKLFFDSTTIPNTFDEIVIFVEFVVGVGLLTTGFSSFFIWPSILLFSTYLIIVSQKLFSGETNCGCFGDLTVSPVLMFVVDTLVLLFLISSINIKFKEPKKGFSLKFGFSFIVLVLGAISFFPSLSPASTKLQAVEVVTEKPLSFLEDVDSNTNFLFGTWRLLLVDSECSVCLESVERFLDNSVGRTGKIGIIEFGRGNISNSYPVSPSVIWGKLKGGKKWGLKERIEVLVVDGVVKEHHEF